VHNAAAVIGRKVRTCLEQDYPAEKLRVLVASDGSSDATCAVVEALGDARVELLAFPRRRGKAACLNDAVARCAEEVIVFTDARQALDPRALRHLVANLGDAAVGAVSGQLVFERDGMTAFGEGLDTYWRYEKFLRRAEGRIHSAVGVTGALYALRRECFREIPSDTVLDDVVIPMNVVLQGRRVIFEDHALVFDRSSRDAREERSRKVRTLAGNFQLVTRHPALLSPWRNPIALQFASHKLMRLVAPLALAVALVANIALAGSSPWFAALLTLQLAAYGCAALGMLWPRANRLRAVKLASAFLTLNWFVVLGFVEFVTNRQAHLWKKAA
jgi:cellulose synthase/poly-beta-1,6-N-acetylglucosamine synthase-like glycosyltransferase